MDYMFSSGFLGTRAPLFMDVVTLIVALLPLLIYAGIMFAKKGLYKLHAFAQNLIYIVSVIVVLYFEYGVRVGGGFDTFVSDAKVSYTYALFVLVFHIAIALATFVYWTFTLIKANKWFKNDEIPGKMSNNHKLMAIKSFVGIIFTSATGIWVYISLFI
jgi:putative membrane protein